MLCGDWEEFSPLMVLSRKGFCIRTIFPESREGGAPGAGGWAVNGDPSWKKVESILELRRQKKSVGLSV